MNAKRLIAFLLALLMSLLVLPLGAGAEAEPRFRFSLAIDGSTVKYARPGDIVTVWFTLERTDSTDPFLMYAFQNEIRYDSTCFALVEDSLFLKDGIQARDIDARGKNRELYMNYVSLTGGTQWDAKTIVGSFQMKVLAETGAAALTSLDCSVSRHGGKSSYSITTQDVLVVISEQCTVSYETGTGESRPTQTVTSGQAVARPADPLREGYHFTGWYADVDCTVPWDFNRTVTSNTRLYAGWQWEDGGEATQLPKEETLPFVDVQQGEWFYDSVCYVYRAGLMNGVSETLFSPNAGTSRAMIVTILWRLEKSPATAYAMKFADVAPGRWYTEAIRWAASTGIVNGYSEVSFGPDDPITREQMAAILWRYAKLKEKNVDVHADLSAYTDADQISSYAIAPMQWACGVGLIRGIGENVLSPKTGATRAQTATILQRLSPELQK